MRLNSLLSLMILTVGVSAVAEKMDIPTDSLVIEKLEKVYKSVDAQDSTRTDLALRLADLYAERARLEAMDDVAKNCENCTQSRDDRGRALVLYQDAFKTSDKDEKSRVVLQMAHLYELQGDSAKANQLYDLVVKHKVQYTPALLGQAYTGLAEEAFGKIKYNEALQKFQKALSIPQSPRRAYIQYRMAWCYFHEDKMKLAQEILIKALQMPDGVSDTSFQEEGTRDLATFYSRAHVTPEEIQILSKLSPENLRKDNLTYLATELDRLGKNSSALLVWNAIGVNQKSPQDQLEGHIRTAELQYDVGKKDQCLVEYQAAIDGWKDQSCTNNQESLPGNSDSPKNDNCVVLRQRLRKLLMDWSHAEGTQPTLSLMKAYSLYLTVFPDMEMNYKAAVTARQLNQFPQSIKYYRNAADIAATVALKKGSKGSDDAKFRQDFEAALLGEIEVAEITKDSILRTQAYQHYVELNPQGPRAFEIKYQEAHLLYENGKYAEAAESFHALALSQETSSLKEKSADLALDSLVLAHQEDKIQTWAPQFAQAFPKRRQDFLKIASQGTLNQVVVVLNNSGASRSELEASFEKLGKMKLDGTTEAEKISYYKDRLLLAEKLQNLPEVQKSAAKLLTFKTLGPADREFALSRQAWVAELTLNFAEAYKVSEKMKLANISESDRQLKLGMLAELAGKNPEKEYRRYLELTKDHAEAAVVAADLVRRSSHPVEELKHHWTLLQTKPALLSILSLEVFSKTHDYKLAEKVISTPALQGTSSLQILSRFVFLKKFEVVDQKLSQHRLARNDKELNHSLRTRLSLLHNMESMVDRAVRSQDWFLQIITLDNLANQNRRLALEIVALPAPKSLNKMQRREYSKLLAQQGAQYQDKARQITAKLSEIWKNYGASSNLLEDYQKAHGPVRKLLASELKIIIHSVPHEKRHDVITVIASREHRPASDVIRAAKASVKENPFNPQDLERLKNLEVQGGSDMSDTLVAYLDARISKLQSGTGK